MENSYSKLKQLDPEAYVSAINMAHGVIFSINNVDHKQAAIIEKSIVNYTLYLLEKK
jgi:hypothetical protein